MASQKVQIQPKMKMTLLGQNPLISGFPRDSRFEKRAVNLSDLFWLTDAQMTRLEHFFPKSRGRPRVDDRSVLGGIVVINRNGLRWRDAPVSTQVVVDQPDSDQR